MTETLFHWIDEKIYWNRYWTNINKNYWNICCTWKMF